MSKEFTCPYKIGLWCPYNGECVGCENNKKEGEYDYECSACCFRSHFGKSNFCPNCGTPMTEEAIRKYNGLKEGESDAI